MTFRQLEYLDALAQCGSITKAAERLFVSQSALSQQIISIEKEHQIQILDRTQKPFTFTETGKTFLKAAQEILEIKRKLEEDLHLRWNNTLLRHEAGAYAAFQVSLRKTGNTCFTGK